MNAPALLRRLPLLVLLGLSLPAGAAEDPALIERARALHQRMVTVDTHVDIPPNFATDAYDFVTAGKRGQQVQIPTMIEGGLTAPFLIVYVAQGPCTTTGYARALADAFTKFAAIHQIVDQHPAQLGLATSAAEVRQIAASGRKAILIGMENGYPMGRDPRLLDQFHAFGARYLGLLHIGHNDLGDSSIPNEATGEKPDQNGGLTALGRQVVHRLNQLGIMADVSHASDRTSLDIIAESTAPVIASHSAVAGIYAHPRNLSDAALKGIARSGGVAQIVAFDSYLKPVPAEKSAAIAALAKELGVNPRGDVSALPAATVAAYDARLKEINEKWPGASVETLVDHIDYAVKLVGIDHVGIASDFNGGGGIEGWSNAAETFHVTAALLRRGYDEAEIAKLWGGNLLRVMDAVAAKAKRAD